MKTKILTSLILASLMSLYFVGCSSEKSVEELEKLSFDELQKMLDEKKCKFKENQECSNIASVMMHKMMNNREYTPILKDEKESKK